MRIGTPRGQNFVNETLQHHLEVMHELIQRDKNRANVIMWSLANEPASNDPRSKDYFESVAKWTRILDSTRPITFVTYQYPGDDYAVSFCQFKTLYQDQLPSTTCTSTICINCYTYFTFVVATGPVHGHNWSELLLRMVHVPRLPRRHSLHTRYVAREVEQVVW